jgi:hydroxymethylbilane synthase
MNAPIRIGTRESKLALWQANHVKDLLEASGNDCELVLIKSEGDVNLTTPLYEIGVQGIFTKALDIALLENRIDIAVHSMKDVPVGAEITTQFMDGELTSIIKSTKFVDNESS